MARSERSEGRGFPVATPITSFWACHPPRQPGSTSPLAAAVAAIARSADVQRIDYARLRTRLLGDRPVLDWTGKRRNRS